MAIQRENRIRFYDWFDGLPVFHRDFINDYGFKVWFELRDRVGVGFAFETALTSFRSRHPTVTRVV